MSYYLTTMALVSSRSRLIAAALALTLVLATVLGANVLITARYHRSVAEGVLRDYADFAAAELANRVQTRLGTRLFTVLSLMAAEGVGAEGASVPPPDRLARAGDQATRELLTPGPTLFRFALARNELQSAGAPLPERLRSLLVDSLPSHAGAVLSTRTYLALLWLPGDTVGRVAAYTLSRAGSGAGSVLYGFVTDQHRLAALVEAAVSRAPLLPPSLTGGVPSDSVVSFRVTAPGGLVLARSAALPVSRFAAERGMDPVWGGVRVWVALREDLAGRLIIGGLPRSRLPLVLLLLALTAVLVVTAAVQLRRESELTRLREEFVAGVSHELRTPLAQIRLFAETLRLGRVRTDDERVRALEIIDQEGRRLTQLVENLLHVSRAGRALTVVPREIDLSEALRDAVDSFAPLASARRVRIQVRGEESVRGMADGEAFRHVVLNLLDNAVKYGPEGQTIEIGLTRGDSWVRLWVDDQGPGVPPDARHRVFERFTRLDRDLGSGTTGTGIGLAIVRDLVQGHGGRCRVETAPSGGARFVVELPTRAPETGGAARGD